MLVDELEQTQQERQVDFYFGLKYVSIELSVSEN